MSSKNVQFSVAAHVMVVLAYHDGKPWEGAPVTSALLANSVNTDVSFVRRVISKLAKAGLVTATRGKNGSCALGRPAKEISMLDIYRASEAPEVFSLHPYGVQDQCPVSAYVKGPMGDVLSASQTAFEASLAEQKLSALLKAVPKKK